MRAASESDFAGGRRPPNDADPSLLKIIEDTALRTKLVEARIAEGLQSPKGPQKIASIVRVYPNFDAPARQQNNGRVAGRDQGRAERKPPRAQRRATQQNLPTVEQVEHLCRRIREIEANVARDLAANLDRRIDELKQTIASRGGNELESAVADLGAALAERRALASSVRAEAFRRIEADAEFAPRVFLALLARR